MVKLIRYLRPYTVGILIMLITLFLQVLGTLYIPTLTAEIVNKGIIAGDVTFVQKTGSIMLAAAAATAGISILSTRMSTSVFSRAAGDMRNDFFRKAQSLSINEFNRFSSASMMTRCTSDISQIQHAFMETAEMLLPAPVMSVAGLILAFRKSQSFALVILFSMIIACILMILVNNKAIKYFEYLQTMLDKINQAVLEKLTGIRDIRAFNRETDEQEKLDKVFEEYSVTAIKVARIFAVLTPLIMAVMNISTILIIIAGGNSVGRRQMEIGDIMAMIEYATLILMYLVMGIMIFMDLPRAQTCASRINEVLDMHGGENADEGLDIETEGLGIRKLEFRNVSFQYQGADEPVLSNISFVAKAGQTIAVIGGTGSGKTTLVNMIPGFFEPGTGTILFNNRDMKDLAVGPLRKHIGFVPQKTYLFSGTISDIFRQGNANASTEDMHKAADTAQILDHIESLKDGFESRVTQGGRNLSGGQRQRLAIARALVRKPDIYVFDDSFSALDFKTDAKLRKALKAETGDKIVILVAQRISTIQNADQIIVLDKGQIAGTGKHEELMESCDVYRMIAASQMKEEELA